MGKEEEYGIVPAHLNWGPVDLDQPINAIPEEHRALYVRDYGLPEGYGTLRQTFGGRIALMGVAIYAVGKDAEGAIRALCVSRDWGEPVIGEPLGGDGGKYDWGYRFTAHGTGFKAAGQDVPGGTILTWWK